MIPPCRTMAKNQNLIDLDANATTAIDPRVLEAMRPHLLAGGNPESRHAVGRRARKAWDEAREQTATLLGAFPDELTFTSGGTEANNLALFGFLNRLVGSTKPCDSSRSPSVFQSSIEHPAVAEPLAWLEKNAGVRREVLPVSADGAADPETWIKAISSDDSPNLIALMLANNETGVIQPVAELAAEAADRGIAFHTDAVQAVGRIDVNFHNLGVTTLAAGSHKMHGPPGIGILLTRRGAKLQPILHGGGQQKGLRPGTPPVGLAVGLAKALELWQAEKAERTTRWNRLQDLFLSELQSGLLKCEIHARRNGPEDSSKRLPQTLNLWLDHLGIHGDLVLMQLDMAGVAVSLGSACASGSTRPSPVLLAMGCDESRARSSIRVSFSAFTTEEEIVRAAKILTDVAIELAAGDEKIPEPEIERKRRY